MKKPGGYLFTAALALAGCAAPTTDAPDAPDATPADGGADTRADAGTEDASADVPRDVSADAATGVEFCSLGGDTPDITVPAGFCVRRFARVGSPRVMAFAPNGDLFVSTPSDFTPGGAAPGPGAIVVFSDDDRDGAGEMHTYADSLPDVHGLAFGGGHLFYTTITEVWRVPHVRGERRAPAARVQVARFVPGANARWTHGLAYASDGTLYGTQGNHGYDTCPPSEHDGSISRVPAPLAAPGATPPDTETVASGFRNPMYIRCHATERLCLASELSDDNDTYGAPEKILVVRDGSMYGYPCCVTTGINSINNVGGGRFNCSGVAAAESSIPLHDTPFGLDWAPGTWPAPYANAVFIALHGRVGDWNNAGVQYAPTSAMTMVPGTTWSDFISFRGRGTSLRRPTDVVFAPDGRLFVADDSGAQIFWVAPVGLRAP